MLIYAKKKPYTASDFEENREPMYMKKTLCIKYFARKHKKLHLKQDDGKIVSYNGIYTR